METTDITLFWIAWAVGIVILTVRKGVRNPGAMTITVRLLLISIGLKACWSLLPLSELLVRLAHFVQWGLAAIGLYFFLKSIQRADTASKSFFGGESGK